MAKILVTGGAGYIGAHVARALVQAGHTPIVVDDLSTGSKTNLAESVALYEGDFGDPTLLRTIFQEHQIEAVMHMAASIEVAESVAKPVAYLHNNTASTLALLENMREAGINRIIFSSTAAVYGQQEQMPITESAQPNPIDPYGHSKFISEQLIQYFCKHVGLSAVVFRYFNACGSDFDQTIYSQHETHLIPVIMEVVAGKRPALEVFGNDYPTVDGTGVRDYVHVLDIARAHLVGLGFLEQASGFNLFNIGTGHGYSVLEVVESARKITGHPIPVKFQPRRPGDAPITVADNTKIKQGLGFVLEHSDMPTIIKTSLRI